MGYHVQCNPDSGVIHAGTINKKGDKWVNKSDVTNEVLEAARDHLLFIAQKNNLQDGAGYLWHRSDGSVLKLTAQIVPQEENSASDDNPEA